MHIETIPVKAFLFMFVCSANNLSFPHVLVWPPSCAQTSDSQNRIFCFWYAGNHGTQLTTRYYSSAIPYINPTMIRGQFHFLVVKPPSIVGPGGHQKPPQSTYGMASSRNTWIV